MCVPFQQEFLDDMAIWEEVKAYDGKSEALQVLIKRHVMNKVSVQQMMVACKD